MCTVWPSHSKWLSEQSNKPASNFVLSLDIPPQKLSRDSEVYNCRQLVIGSFIMTIWCMTHAPRLVQSFWWNIKSPRWFSLPTSQIWCPVASGFFQNWNHLWKGRYFRPLMRITKIWQGNWWQLGELCEVPRCLLWRVLRHHCPVDNVSCIFFNKCLRFSHDMAGYLLDRPCDSNN